MNAKLKNLISLCVFLFSASIFAQRQPPTSESMCGQRSCTKEMWQIYNGFMQAPQELTREGQAYSGNCYHIHPNISPIRAHHGLMLLEAWDLGQEMTFSGLFSFFTEQNPYAGKSFIEIQDFMNARSARKHPVSFLIPTEPMVTISSATGANYYWFKISGNKAYLMSLWSEDDSGTDIRIYCDLTEKARL